jgi:hypothetical protein
MLDAIRYMIVWNPLIFLVFSVLVSTSTGHVVLLSFLWMLGIAFVPFIITATAFVLHSLHSTGFDVMYDVCAVSRVLGC